MNETAYRIGADVGGTFTDVILMDAGGNLWTHKIPSTPPDFERAVLEAIARLLKETGTPGESIGDVSHGTTVATNAVLERRGARTALITTRGFRDVLELRRVRAPQMYDLFFDKPEPIVERSLRLEVTERIAADGEVLAPLDVADLRAVRAALEQEKVESIAVCTLHSYAYPRHEHAIGEFLQDAFPDLPVSLSTEILPERREYERTATTVLNAYVRPVMQRYLNAMRDGLTEQGIPAPVLIMQSAGGLTPEADAARRPVYVLESGPAAGVFAARSAGEQLGIHDLITFDMGGTTAKASIVENGEISYSPEYEVGASVSAGNRLVGGGGELIRAPSIDIAEVGSGGGSVALLDGAGGLRVGPGSAGAVPGPACYGRGGNEPTVTDANVVLGYIRPGELADGEVSIDPEAARRIVHDRIAAPLGLDLLEAAEGIHRIANARCMRALRSVSTERGRDPRSFSLIAFGGSGPVHAAGLARELQSPKVIVPPLPGLFSALGLLFSGVEHHEVSSCLLSGDGLSAEALGRIQSDLKRKMLARFRAEGYSAEQVALDHSVDVRFRGQASEIRIPLPESRATDATVRELCGGFELEHRQLYGHSSDPDIPVEVVAVRLIGRTDHRGTGGRTRASRRHVRKMPSRSAYFGKAWGTVETPVVGRTELTGPQDGPLLIDEYDSTTVVPPGTRVYRDRQDFVVLEATEA
ncbi:MAG: hydantoinase/oxoprolinase family protein [Candidatus Latescibacteria bacterium]|nr:hydantoinase/oxoprolinase family protein [Candidatus Latescibacterota bacterium]